jgi:hypothetical protein
MEFFVELLFSLKVIEPGARSGDLCTRREYARWLVVASNCLSRYILFLLYVHILGIAASTPVLFLESKSHLCFLNDSFI